MRPFREADPKKVIIADPNCDQVITVVHCQHNWRVRGPDTEDVHTTAQGAIASGHRMMDRLVRRKAASTA